MKRSIAVGLMISGAFAQFTLLAGQKGGDPDDRISDQVRMKLATDPDVKGGALDVTVKDGVVVIKGRVDSDKGKEQGHASGKEGQRR